MGLAVPVERGQTATAEARPVKAPASAVTADMTVADGFRMIAADCIVHLRANEAALIQCRDEEALHQSRVAIRRLRACLSVFKGILRKRTAARVHRQLKQVFDKFGQCRDLDVFLAGPNGVARLAPGDLVAARDAAYDGAVRLVHSKRYQAMVKDMAKAIRSDGWLRTGRQTRALARSPLVDFARHRLDHCLARVDQRGRGFERLTPKAQHRLRIAVKKLRYAAEFFAGLFDGGGPAKRRRQFLAAIEDLQYRLGVLNDIAVGETIQLKIGRGGNGRGKPDKASRRSGRAFVTEQTAAAARALEALRQPKPFWS